MSPRRRRMALALAGAAALVALVVVPSWLASRPDFFSRYPSLAEQYRPWSTSTHVEAGCEGCHSSPKPLSRAWYRLRLAGEFYLSFVTRSRTPSLFGEPTNEACLTCHSDLRTVSPEGDLQIPHRAHVTILKMKCVACHDYLVHELSPAGGHTPPMAGCLKCHDGDTAKDTCTACHTAKAAPASHAKDTWDIEHARYATDPACEKCHGWTKDWCADCHARRPKSHSAQWRKTHGAAVATHRSCEACHEKPFCVRCHGQYPDAGLDPALKLVR